ncbi:MAG: 1-deoxy-D-xylulose-5-phosphate reductoisomerase [Acidobacteria bacterium]|nr:1-deoxy-D-xylulose-5-phosphate reductoisomerase [Acidobacteriota bacterium]
MTKGVAILGSTGSIGRSTLEVIDEFADRFEVTGLAAGGNLELLADQIRRVRPSLVSVRKPESVEKLRELLGDDRGSLEIVHGADGASQVATMSEADIVVAGIVGAAGIPPVHAALKKGKRVGIANKEVLVAAGEVMMRAAREGGGMILPIDSEHCAVHQALVCGHQREVRRIVLTASGGPLLSRKLSELDSVTVDEALAHPTWQMGNKISIDSATMMNKGLEVIEAHHLFGFDANQIGIIIHPQSIVHSMVEYIDGSIIAQLSTTDMKFPIQYCLTWPDRIEAPYARLDLAQVARLEFLEVEAERFPAVALAYRACRTGGSMPAVLNAANEVAVERFLAGGLPFRGIVEVVRRTMDAHESRVVARVSSVEEALEWDRWARNEAGASLVD